MRGASFVLSSARGLHPTTPCAPQQIWSGQRLRWVMNVDSARFAARPLCNQERPLSRHCWRSQTCHEHALRLARVRCAACQVSSNVRGSRRYRSSDPEAKRVEPDIDMALESNGRTDKFTLVAPGAAADDTEAGVTAPEPR